MHSKLGPTQRPFLFFSLLSFGTRWRTDSRAPALTCNSRLRSYSSPASLSPSLLPRLDQACTSTERRAKPSLVALSPPVFLVVSFSSLHTHPLQNCGSCIPALACLVFFCFALQVSAGAGYYDAPLCCIHSLGHLLVCFLEPCPAAELRLRKFLLFAFLFSCIHFCPSSPEPECDTRRARASSQFLRCCFLACLLCPA